MGWLYRRPPRWDPFRTFSTRPRTPYNAGPFFLEIDCCKEKGSDNACEKEWQEAREVCQDPIANNGPITMRGCRNGRPYTNVEDCARGLVSDCAAVIRFTEVQKNFVTSEMELKKSSCIEVSRSHEFWNTRKGGDEHR